jgi:hypothetical protein
LTWLTATTIALLAVAGLIGIGCVVLYAIYVAPSPRAALGILFLAMAALICGVLLGFLFGLPRSRTAGRKSDSQTSQGDANTPPDDDLGEQIRFTPNTNLEDVADWLTKILIGVGLVQLSQIGTWVTQFAENVANGLGDNRSSGLIVCALTYFTGLGFLIGYLWSRISFWQLVTITSYMFDTQRIQRNDDQPG